MRWLRFWHDTNAVYGILDDDGRYIHPVAGDPFGEYQIQSERLPLAEARLAPPMRPSKILAVALNYPSHLGEQPPPGNPELFLKPPSALIGPGGTIVLPADSARVDYEGEVVVVVARRLRHASEEEAEAAIFGYTCGNDVSARDWQRADRQWWRAKGSDTFAPLGPWIVTGLDPRNIALETRVDGEVRQTSTTAQLIHSIPKVLAFASEVMTLEPGDLVYTGTPGEPQPLRDGQVVEVEVGGVGVLRNPVVAERRQSD